MLLPKTYKDKVRPKPIPSTFLSAPIHPLTLMVCLLTHSRATIPSANCTSQSDPEPTRSLSDTMF